MIGKKTRGRIKADLILTYLNNERKMVPHINDEDWQKIRERITELVIE